MKKVLVRLAVSDILNGDGLWNMLIEVADDATESDIHEEAYRQFRGLCVDVDDYEEYE